MTHRTRVLIVDDSPFMRMAIRRILATVPGLEVVGAAADGVEGVEQALALKPDVITMDVEMPRMDGITAVKKIMSSAPTRIVMVSSLTREGAAATFEALEAGAVDYILKPAAEHAGAQAQFTGELLQKIAGASSAVLTAHAPPAQVTPADPADPSHPGFPPRRTIACIAIGASTGGPVAVQEIISALPATFPCPVVVAVHMPKAFTGPFAERLNAKCPIAVREARDGDLLRAGTVLIAPGGQHTTFVRGAEGVVVRISPATAQAGVYVPSVDLLMGSLADSAEGAVLGVILTGMGSDGCRGMQQVKQRGGVTLVQDQVTSTVYGMPKACIDGGIADAVLPLFRIGPALGQMVAG